jgi:glycosyltransferase involved in cell wall biosynthesis
LALAQRHGDVIAAYVLNPDLPPPGEIEPLVATGRVQYAPDVVWEPGGIWHAVSPIELGVPLERQWPSAVVAAGMRVAVTVHDLIPERLPAGYLADPGLRRRFRTRLEFIRHADLIFAISECTASDTVELLNVDPARVVRVGSAPAAFFQPAANRSAAGASARALVPGLRDQFVLYTAGMDDRKNLEGLLAGWARVPRDVRARWQLAVACRADDLEINHYRIRARHFGVESTVLFTGYVTDDALLALNQSADLVVFPSLYEGFGLPVVEALACGTPVVAGDNSSLPELLDPVALFDATEPDAIAGAVTRGLTDEVFRAALLTQCARPVPSWDDVADRMAAGYAALAARPARPPRTRRRVAFVSPMPPQRTGVGEWSYLMVDELRKYCAVDVLADGFHLDDDKPAAVRGSGVGRLRRSHLQPGQQRVSRRRVGRTPAAAGGRHCARGAPHRPVRVVGGPPGSGAESVRGNGRALVSRCGSARSARRWPARAGRRGAVGRADDARGRRVEHALPRDERVRRRVGTHRCGTGVG